MTLENRQEKLDKSRKSIRFTATCPESKLCQISRSLERPGSEIISERDATGLYIGKQKNNKYTAEWQQKCSIVKLYY